MEFCSRCGCPVEEPITYADEVCAASLHVSGDACSHIPVCVHCADVQRHEVLEALRRSR